MGKVFRDPREDTSTGRTGVYRVIGGLLPQIWDGVYVDGRVCGRAL